MVAGLRSAGRIRPDQEEDALVNLLKREAVGPTGIGQGVAVPHARLRGLKDLTGALGISPGGVQFTSLDGSLVHVVFLILAPESAVGGYLNLLALVSRIVRDGGFLTRALSAKDPAEVARILRTSEERLGGS